MAFWDSGLSRVHIQLWVAGWLAHVTSSATGPPTSIPFLNRNFLAITDSLGLMSLWDYSRLNTPKSYCNRSKV